MLERAKTATSWTAMRHWPATPNFSAWSRSSVAQRRSFSTKSALAAPLLSISKPNDPLPAQRSAVALPLILGCSISAIDFRVR